MADKKFKTGAVLVDIIKDVPYLRSLETDSNGKFTAKPILEGKVLFAKGSRQTLRYDLAGRYTANGYAKILDEQKQAVDTKIASK